MGISPEKIHDALYFSSLYIGEGATMASESAVLGTPSIYVNKLKLGYINEQKEYGLIYQTQSLDKILSISEKILLSKNSKKYFDSIRQKLLSNKINLTDYLCQKILSYH